MSLPSLSLETDAMVRPRFVAALTALAALSLACGPSEPGMPEQAGTAADRPGSAADATLVIDPDDVVNVLPRDAIPSIDEPRFIAPAEATWLADREPVISLELQGEARAYPAQILTRHEIVNDTVGGTPVAVTYCPLCNSGVAFERTVADRVLEFGVSGKLYRSALIMYDRQTRSLWTHFTGVAFRGPLEGTQLELIPVQLLSFADWRGENPDGLVLSRETGYDLDYGENPYQFYDSRAEPYEFYGATVPGPLEPLDRVVGVSFGTRNVAYPYSVFVDREEGGAVLLDRIGPHEIVIFWRAGTASALDTADIARGRDVGATGVFEPNVGRSLTFTVEAGRIVDVETGSTWSLTGRAVAGALEGARLEPIEYLDTFWFAWQAYRTGSSVYGAA